MNPRYITIISATIIAMEYLGRFIFLKPRNLTYLGQFLANVGVAVMYIIFEVYKLERDFGHEMARWMTAVYFSYLLFFLAIDHIQQLKGMERRDNWISIARKSLKKNKKK